MGEGPCHRGWRQLQWEEFWPWDLTIPIVHHEELFFFKWVQTKEEGTGYGESIKKGEVKLGIRSENGLLWGEPISGGAGCICCPLWEWVKFRNAGKINFFSFIFISWRLITSQHFSGFGHTLIWISHGVTCGPHPDPPVHLPLHPILWVFPVPEFG